MVIKPIAKSIILAAKNRPKVMKAMVAIICCFALFLTINGAILYQNQMIKAVAGYFREPLTNEYYPNLSDKSEILDTKLVYATYIYLFINDGQTQTEESRNVIVDKLLSCFFKSVEEKQKDDKGKETTVDKYIVVTSSDDIFTKIETTFQITISSEDRHNIYELKDQLQTIGFGSTGELSEFALQFVGENHTRFTTYSSKNGSGFGDNWCAMFVSYCTDQCGYIDDGVIHYFVGCTSNGIVKFRSEGRFEESAAHGGTYVPTADDIIFFNWDGGNSSADHVGIVTGVEGTVVSTVEGNSGSSWTTSTVKEKKYELSSQYIVGYFPLSRYVDISSNSKTATQKAA